MERDAFDALARLIATQRSRRSAIAALLGATLLGPRPSNADGRKGKTRGHRRHHDKSPGSGKARRTDEDEDKGAGKRNRRKAKIRDASPGVAAVAACCGTGNCAPGRGKNLATCCYQGQNLSGANFQGANLGEANFSGATLTGADLQRANLGKACLVDADLRGARIDASTNLGGAIYCRTQTDGGANNAGCDKGTECCPTCDANHPCAGAFVCCNGRCVPGDCCDNGQRSSCSAGEICCGNRCAAGDCCAAADCPAATCQRRACQNRRCSYEPVFGQSGPRCQTICCEDARGAPVCCAAGVTACQGSGICGCGRDGDCGTNERCCAGTCIPKARCCEGNNAEGCEGDSHCCALDGIGVCRACCNADQCPDETCLTKSCGANNTCQYTPVFGDDGPGCNTICCQNANEQPVCCPDGTAVCTASRRCRCDGAADCKANQLCCNGACIDNTRCCDGDPGTCPAPGVCHARACADGACQPRGVTGGSCPYPGGGTGECRDGTCACPSPRISCNNVCCSEGVTQCAPNGTCPRVCDVCPGGCPFTTVAAAVAAARIGDTIRICAGTYATLDVKVDKDLTIVGAGSGADGTNLDGQRTNRIFTIADGTTVTIRDLAVTKGFGTQQDNTGSNIRVLFDAALTLERVEVTDGTNPSGFGLGAIYVAPRGTLLLKESRVANNRNFSFGGGIMTDDDATVTLEASRIEGNSAGFGGGIWIDTGGVVNLDDRSIITGNFAFQGRGGGGIFNKGRVNGATTSNVTGNTAGNPPAPDNCANSQGGTGCPA